MTEFALTTQDEAVRILGSFFAAIKDDPVTLTVREDKCFRPGASLPLGEIHLKQGSADPSEDEHTRYEEAVRYGFFEWHLPGWKESLKGLLQAIKPKNDRKSAGKQSEKAEYALRQVAAIAARVGLIHPLFDAAAASNMPLRRPTTVVADTSAVLHGGLDFLVRFLCPMARIKIPAIVHMEILNSADNYFKLRRQEPAQLKRGAALLEHVKSQGSQRVLLRLELRTDTEIERTTIFADPLRNAFQPDKSSDVRDLGVSAPVRSYCDRLILETALQHRSQSSAAHPVMLMTTDQGLARMALAEGLPPLFFKVTSPDDVFGKTLIGTPFHPFSGKLYEVPLASLLWELAVAFGSIQLASTSQPPRFFEVAAIGETLSWQPFHSEEDLLWVCCDGFQFEPETAKGKDDTTGSARKTKVSDKHRGTERRPAKERDARKQSSPRPLTGSYRFSVESMIGLVEVLNQKRSVTEEAAAKVLSLSSTRQLADYRNFLLAGEFIKVSGKELIATNRLEELSQAIKALDSDALGHLFLFVPSFKAFVDELQASGPIRTEAVNAITKRAVPNYVTIAEICACALSIPEKGIYSTPNNPPPHDFAAKAIDCYGSLKRGETYVLTGAWLEALASEHGIHPLRSRQRLKEARSAGHLERYTEGATPETRFEKHLFRMLETRDGDPRLRVVHLYHGDFLTPGRASVSMRLERRSK